MSNLGLWATKQTQTLSQFYFPSFLCRLMSLGSHEPLILSSPFVDLSSGVLAPEAVTLGATPGPPG